jgi:hypothetical protein
MPGYPPTNCWRCGAPLYPGYPVCSNCGLDLRVPWMPPVQKSRSKLPVFLAIGAVAVLAAAGLFIVLNNNGGWNPGVEPTPPTAWHSFTSPDNSWSVMFPNSATPRTMTQSMDYGFGSMDVKLYADTDGGAAYEAAAMEMPSAALTGSTDSMLSEFEKGLGMIGKVDASRALTFKTYSAREIKFTMTSMGLNGQARFWLVNQRLYLLMVMSQPGTTTYPEHFFDSFNMN